MWQNERSLEPEILDLGPDFYSSDEYDACLKLLSRINCLLGGFKATFKALKALQHPVASILEVGCGGGYLCKAL
jgi:2-polyprenyl-3-methyl-5-hydroxy-6-metoxy-1,4-benzoquinol methylase